jgi:hypothetical protein
VACSRFIDVGIGWGPNLDLSLLFVS